MADNEPLYGAAHELREAGYVPMPGTAKEDNDDKGMSVAEAADAYADRFGKASDIVVRKVVDEDGNPVADNVALTLEQAAEYHANELNADIDASEASALDDVAREADELRRQALEDDSAAADIYGIDPLPTAEPVPVAQEMPKEMQEKVAAAEQAQQQYTQSTTAAFELAQATLATQFPEFIGLDAAQREAAVQRMAQSDPDRYSRLTNLVQSAEQLQMHNEFAKRQGEQQKVASFNNYAKTEDAKVDEYLAKETPEQRAAIRNQLFETAKSEGLDQEQFLNLFRTEPIMRNSVFQKMMLKAARYDMLQNATRPRPAAKPVPHVQKPGASSNFVAADNISSLSSKLSRSGSVDDAFELYKAKQRRG